MFNDWTDCSVSCGEGQRRRVRLCKNPAPDHGGLDCEGEGEETEVCNKGACRKLY